jgi:hypothetical protein
MEDSIIELGDLIPQDLEFLNILFEKSTSNPEPGNPISQTSISPEQQQQLDFSPLPRLTPKSLPPPQQTYVYSQPCYICYYAPFPIIINLQKNTHPNPCFFYPPQIQQQQQQQVEIINNDDCDKNPKAKKKRLLPQRKAKRKKQKYLTKKEEEEVDKYFPKRKRKRKYEDNDDDFVSPPKKRCHRKRR